MLKMAPVEGRNVRSMFLTSCLAVVFGLKSFCYICEKFTVAVGRCSITLNMKKLYHACFGVKLGNQDKDFATCVACISCVSKLCMWYQKKLKSLPFGVLMV